MKPVFTGMLFSQIGQQPMRACWPHEVERKRKQDAYLHDISKSDFDRLWQFSGVRDNFVLDDIAVIANSSAGIEVHHSLPLWDGYRPFIFMVEHACDMLAPFQFEHSRVDNGELSTFVAAVSSALASDGCIGIFTPHKETANVLRSYFQSPAIDKKLNVFKPVIPASVYPLRKEPGRMRLMTISRPAQHNAYGTVSKSSLRLSLIENLLAFQVFKQVRTERPDARLLWLSPDWRQSPNWWAKTHQSPADLLDSAWGAAITDDIANAIAEGAVLAVDTAPAMQELDRYFASVDCLLDFALRPDINLRLAAARSGCMLAAFEPQTYEGWGIEPGDAKIKLPSALVRSGFFGGPDSFKSDAGSLEELSNAVRSAADQIFEHHSDEARRLAFRHREADVYSKSSAAHGEQNLAFVSVISKTSATKPQRLYSLQSFTLTACDIDMWQTPVQEHRFDALNIVKTGANYSDAGQSSAKRPVLSTLTAGRSSLLPDDIIRHYSKTELFAARPGPAEKILPGKPIRQVENIDGSLDLVDGRARKDGQIVSSASLELSGWMIMSASEGKLPEAVYIGFTNPKGTKFYVNTKRVLRNDVASHFGKEELLGAGFVAEINIAEFNGATTLSVLRETATYLEHCPRLDTKIVVDLA